MRPAVWQPPVELSPAEQQIVKRIKRAKLFIFLRQHCHTLFDEAFQQELATMYEVAAATGAFGSHNLRAALDSSPLWGAGRLEDTYTLLGHALRKALGVIARQQGRDLARPGGAQAPHRGGRPLRADPGAGPGPRHRHAGPGPHGRHDPRN